MVRRGAEEGITTLLCTRKACKLEPFVRVASRQMSGAGRIGAWTRPGPLPATQERNNDEQVATGKVSLEHSPGSSLQGFPSS
jgi:hypothetical protein